MDAQTKALFERYVAACDYPGTLDAAAVERHLADYCRALKVERQIVRIEAGWTLEQYPSLARYVDRVLKDFADRNPRAARAALGALGARDALAARAARDARDAQDAWAARGALAARDARDALAAQDARAAQVARAARDARDALAARGALAARDARDALAALAAQDARAALGARDTPSESMHRFAAWCVQSNGWWYSRFDLSWIAITHFGALQLGHPHVQAWAAPVLGAYLSGCWYVHWTDDTLYWVAKPTVHVERGPHMRRLHHESGPALESDVENLYFWHGVMVPAFVIVRPDWITVKHIETEDNAEVRRVMIQRYGTARYIQDSGAECVHQLPDNYYVRGLQGAKLYRKGRPGDSDIVMISVRNSTPEPDGSIKEYMLRVQPDAYGGKAACDCHAAMASTWRREDGGLYFKSPQDYRPGFES